MHHLQKNSLEKIKILVIGDLMIDHYMWGNCDRISPEAPVPIVDFKKEEVTLGGAGNVLKNLISFGVSADIISVIGDDFTGDELCNILKRKKLKLNGIFREANRLTTKKTRVLVSNHQMIRIDKESKESINKDSENKIISFIKENILHYDILLISDYLKGTLTDNVLQAIIKCANENNKITIVDPKGKDFSKYKGANIVKPNKKEASIASEMIINDTESLYLSAMKLRSVIDSDTIIITLSEDGMAIYNDDFEIIPTQVKEICDVTGAGDTVLASLGICIACGMDVKNACVFANHAAALVVSKVGSAVTTIDDVLEHIDQNNMFLN